MPVGGELGKAPDAQRPALAACFGPPRPRIGVEARVDRRCTMKTTSLAWLGAFGLLIATGAEAAQFVYPAQGQDRAKQARDEAECSTWASQQTGFDPARAMAPAPMASAPMAPTASTAAPGATNAMESAAATAALSALGGAGGLGGAAGMLGGAMHNSTVSEAAGMLGQVMTQQQQQQQAAQQQAAQQQAAQQQAAQQQMMQAQMDYERARGACLTGRGYSVR
jgi:hypothetical protein